MSEMANSEEKIKKSSNWYWYNADNQVSLQLSDDNFFIWGLQKLLKTLDFQKIVSSL